MSRFEMTPQEYERYSTHGTGRRCACCGKAFKSLHGNQRYCRVSCITKHRNEQLRVRRMTPTSRKCEVCDKALFPHQARFCGHKCHGISMQTAPIVDGRCEMCDAALNTGTRFCSIKCSSANQNKKSRNEQIINAVANGARLREVAEQYGISCARVWSICRNAGVHAKGKETRERFCQGCGSKITGWGLKYCSRECSGKRHRARKPRKMYSKTCPHCHGQFNTRYDRQVHCSHSCARSAAYAGSRQ